MKKQRLPTMKDVARLSGVSQTTVSFVINKVSNPSISPKTKQAVLRAVKELGYRPNVFAQSLRTRQSHVIGLISDEIATTPFAGKLILGVMDALRENAKLLMMMDYECQQELEEQSIEALLGRQIEGLIYSTMRHKAITAPKALHEVPSILLNCRDTRGEFPAVVPDEFSGGYEATRQLISSQYKTIGLINTAEHVPASELREKGYRQALADNGFQVSDELIYYGEDGVATTGYNGLKTLMEKRPGVDGVFCFNDRVAMGAYDAARALGKAIPRDLGIVGFDDFTVISENLHPSLTTMRLPHYEMGKKAAQILLRMVEKPKWRPRPLVVKVAASSVLRNSHLPR